MTMQALTGRVVNIYESILQTQLTVDAAAGALVLNVADTVLFQPSTVDVLSQARVVGEDASGFDVADIVTIDGVDHNALTLMLRAGLPRARVAEDRVELYPESTERYAHVYLDDYTEGEPLAARVPYTLWDRLSFGPRNLAAGEGEAVTIDQAGVEYVVTDVLGERPRLIEAPGTVYEADEFRLVKNRDGRYMTMRHYAGPELDWINAGFVTAYIIGGGTEGLGWLSLYADGDHITFDVEQGRGPIRVRANEIILNPNVQAKGYCGVRFLAASASDFDGHGVMYGGVSTLSNVPSSISLTVVGDGDQNVKSVIIGSITLRGFLLRVDANASGAVRATRHFTTVGN